MMSLDLSTPYTNFEEYGSFTPAYVLSDWSLGFEQQMDSVPQNMYFFNNYNVDSKVYNSYQSMFDLLTGMREPFFVNPTPSTVEYYGVDIMSEKKEHKSDDELFKEAYDACEAVDISEIDIHDFIDYCEKRYKMPTSEFLKWFKERNFEGNVDMQLWSIYGKSLDNMGEEK
jgi:hypothetical protein